MLCKGNLPLAQRLCTGKMLGTNHSLALFEWLVVITLYARPALAMANSAKPFNFERFRIIGMMPVRLARPTARRAFLGANQGPRLQCLPNSRVGSALVRVVCVHAAMLSTARTECKCLRPHTVRFPGRRILTKSIPPRALRRVHGRYSPKPAYRPISPYRLMM